LVIPSNTSAAKDRHALIEKEKTSICPDIHPWHNFSAFFLASRTSYRQNQIGIAHERTTYTCCVPEFPIVGVTLRARTAEALFHGREKNRSKTHPDLLSR
jgi:hypothetical protein